MADVLSQSQIDALLENMRSNGSREQHIMEQRTKKEDAKCSKYDFYSPRKFTKDKMRILNSIFENYARILTSQVNGIFRVMTDITVLEVQERRYYEFANSLHENDSITMVNTEVENRVKNNVPLMLHVTPGLVITLINHMLGGGEEIVKVEANYRYSDVEIALYRRIVDYFVQALRDGFSNYINIDFKVRKVEENLSMVQEVGLDETVAIIHLNVDVSGVTVEKIRLCIPGILLEFIFHLIDSRKHIARGFAYEDNRDIILDNIRSTCLPITGQLGTAEIGLKDLSNLQVGDVISLNKPRDSAVKIFVGRQPWFTGKMGIHKKNTAVRIEERICVKTEEGRKPEAADKAEANEK